MVIVLPVPVEVIEPPELEVAAVPEIPMGVEELVVEVAITAVATATTPSGIGVLLVRPITMQLRVPVPLQLTNFPLLLATAPGLTVIDKMSAVEYVMTHCTPDGSVAPVVAIDMLKLTVDPGAPATELLEMFTCAKAEEERPPKSVSKEKKNSAGRWTRRTLVRPRTIVVDLWYQFPGGRSFSRFGIPLVL
jgi:hypothetical protein